MDKPCGRRRGTGFIVFALVALGAIAPAAAQSTAVRVVTVPNFDTAPVYAALQEGYFKAEGLDVTLQTSQQGGAVGLPAMAGGAFEISYTNATSMLLAMDSGIDLRIIASASFTGSEPPDPAGILSRKADNLTNGKQLEGKTIGVSARLNFNWLLTRGWVKATGGDPDKVTYRELPLPQHLDALKARQVDAVMTTDPFLTAGLRDPDLAIVGWPFSTVLPHVQIGFYVTMAQTAEKRPELVDKFVDGLRKGSVWVNANVGTEPYLKLIQSYTKMEPALIASIKLPQATTDVDAASVTKIAALMRENGMLKTDIDVAAKLYKPRRPATSKGE